MKKKILTLLILLLALSLAACGQKAKEKPLILCSIYPEYDWLMNVLGDEAKNFDVKVILDGDTDLHSYQPVARDIADIINCDLLIYVGGEGDAWIDEALSKNKQPEGKLVINLLEELGELALSEEVTEGMQEGLFSHEEEEELDEHVWLSINNAIYSSKLIATSLAKLAPDRATAFEANCQAYTDKLEALNKNYMALKEELSDQTIIVADRFPFRYLVNDLDLKYYAAFSGCSADSEASFKTVTFLADKLKETESKKLFVLENSDNRLAESIFTAADITDGQVLVLDSMQSKNGRPDGDEYSYFIAMENNYRVLRSLVEDL